MTNRVIYKLLSFVLVALLSGCANISTVAAPLVTTWEPPRRCTDGQGQWWHIFAYDLEAGSDVQLTDGQVIDTLPTFSPDGSQVAFIRDGSTIQTVDTNSHRVETLIELEGYCSDLEWSPDGTRFALVADWSGIPQIYITNTDGTNITRLTGQEKTELSPSWSPDGKQIAFLSPSNLLDTMAVYTATVDVLPQAAREVMTRFCSGNEPCSSFDDVAWSPDNATIACVTNSHGWSFVPGNESGTLFLQESDGASIVTVELQGSQLLPTTLAWTPIGNFDSLSWSFDGQWILYYNDCGCGYETIGAVDLASRQRQTLLEVPVDTGHVITAPILSPDGKTVIYLRASCAP